MDSSFIQHFTGTVFRFIDEAKKTRSPLNAAEYRADLNKIGYGAFFTVNGFKGQPKRENLAVLNAFFADLDGIKDLSGVNLPVDPTFIVRTKNGFHLYWLLDEQIHRDEVGEEAWEKAFAQYCEVEERLIAGVGADKNAKDPTRILRVPGSFHWKDPKNPFEIKVVEENQAMRYSIEEMAEAFPVKEDKSGKDAKKKEHQMPRSDFFRMLDNAFPIENRPSFQALISGLPGTIPTTGSELDRSRNRALLVAASLTKKAGWTLARALDHFKVWHGIEKERGGMEEIHTAVSSAYANDYHFGAREACIAWNITQEEEQAYSGAVASVLKARKEIDRAFFSEYEKTLLKRHPHLKKNDAGMFFEYEGGIYVYRKDADLEDMILRDMYDDGLWGFRTRSFVKDKINCLRSITPRLIETIDNRVVNVKNGLVDIATGEIRAHTPEFVSLIQLPVEYDPNATCPAFEQFVHEVMEGDEEEGKSKILQEFAGSCLSASNKHAKALFLIGDGNNGKSVFAETIAHLIGDDHTSHISLEDLYTHFGVIGIFGKRLNVCEEVPGNYYQSHKLKALVSGEKLTTNVKYKDQFKFRPQAKFIFAVNEMPRVDDTTKGTERRLLTVRFGNSFTGRENKDLRGEHGTLAKELSGILNWAIEGARRIEAQNGFTTTQEHAELMKEYRDEISSPDAFFTECMEFSEGNRLEIAHMYEHYKIYCRDAGLKPKGRPAFTRIIRMMPENGKRFTLHERKNGHEQPYVEGLKPTGDAATGVFSPYRSGTISSSNF